MMNRRNFLKGALALVATPIVGTVVAESAPTNIPTGTVYFDIESDEMYAMYKGTTYDAGYYYAPYIPVVKSITVHGDEPIWLPVNDLIGKL